MLGFKSFHQNTVLLEDNSIFYLAESITHLEDASVEEFIDTIENLSSLIASEKLDGANLIFGFENNGKFYTSREAKSGGRMYSASDFQLRAADNGFRASHVALEKVVPILRKFLKNGQAIEVEVLFGRQPNAIVYSNTNYLAFLRALPGDSNEIPDQSVIKKLSDALKGHEVRIKTPMLTTTDGVKIQIQEIETDWKYTSVSYINNNHFKKVDVSKELNNLKKHLTKKVKFAGLAFSIAELLALKLTDLKGLSKEQKDELKAAREHEFDHVKKTFKLPIKEKIVDAVLRNLKPALQDVDVEPHEDIGVEGIVLLNPKTMQQLKIVDKDIFTIINQFNFAIRSKVKTGIERGNQFPDISLGLEVSIFGSMLNKISSILGAPSLGRPVTSVGFIRKYAGSSPKATLKNLKDAIPQKSFGASKTAIITAVEGGIKAIADGLDRYNREWHTYSLKLRKSTGEEINKEIKYSKAIHERTLMVFAETRKELHDIDAMLHKAKTMEDILVSLYGTQIKKLHGIGEAE